MTSTTPRAALATSADAGRPALRVVGLRKRYGDVVAVDGLDLTVASGEGFTLNVPLPAGTGDDLYGEVIRDQILPALRGFAPDVLILSAGFDAWQHDPLGGMRVTEEGFRSWGDWLRDLAAEVCGGRVLALLEGGYDLRSLPRLVEAHLEGLAGGRTL